MFDSMVKDEHVFQDGVSVNCVVAMCDSKYKSLWLAILFGYKFIMQGVGVFLAFKIRKVYVSLQGKLLSWASKQDGGGAR